MKLAGPPQASAAALKIAPSDKCLLAIAYMVEATHRAISEEMQ